MLPYALIGLLLAPPGAVVEARPGRVEIDWTAGRLSAVGAGAPDLRAPGPDIARIGAERLARKDAARRLAEAANDLAPRADAARLKTALAHTRDLDVRYSSDGATEVVVSVPLEALHGAMDPPAATPVADEKAPTGIVITLKKDVPPILGVTLTAGATRYAGPTVWRHDADDPRLGPRVEKAAGTAGKDGTIAVDLDEAKLAAAAKAGALVVVVLKRWDGKR